MVILAPLDDENGRLHICFNITGYGGVIMQMEWNFSIIGFLRL